MTIDTVVFDIGNVLLEWDPRHLYRKVFADPAEMDRFLSEVCTPAWNLAQDAGRPWSEAEAELIAKFPHYDSEIRAFRARWHEMIPCAIAGTIELLERLDQAGIPLYAITNFAADTYAEARVRFPFLTRFRGTIVSGDERVLKPDSRIYRLLLDRHGLDASRCVFIDDSPKNVAGARAVGMTAIHFQTPVRLADDLARLGFACAM